MFFYQLSNSDSLYCVSSSNTETITLDNVEETVTRKKTVTVGHIWKCSQNREKGCKARIHVFNDLTIKETQDEVKHRHFADPTKAAVNQVILVK